MITEKDKGKIKELMKEYRDVSKMSNEQLERLADGFIDEAIDYGWLKENMCNEIYYYFKDLDLV